MNLITLCGALALAQPTAAAPQADPATVPAVVASTVKVPALTPLRLRVEGEVNSNTHVTGDKIVIVLAVPLKVTDTLAIPAGTKGVGEVVHAAKKGMGGKAGELLLAARTLELAPGVTIPLRSFRLAPATGKNNEGLATGLMIAGGAIGGIAAMVTTGHSAVVPNGTEAFAKTSADIELPLHLLVPTVNAGVPIVLPQPVTSNAIK
ncbi:hypothetical protein [Sphingomonas sp. LY160]|uniref:hypothetical protein n=1 Tax=Sphingomonas sp. LY160 TaxID=3095342 RepID=UPI002ADEB232|nr:hypothetical protein [Sphingomonas sp. LY160]MEA1072498.1 hypothetical protein [Sphingomonas sp. LY160]